MQNNVSSRGQRWAVAVMLAIAALGATMVGLSPGPDNLRKAHAQVTGLRSVPLGYQQITMTTVAASLNPPAGATTALITVSTNAVRFRDDGTAPTASLGVTLPVTTAGLPFAYSGTLSAIQFFPLGNPAVLDVLYYR